MKRKSSISTDPNLKKKKKKLGPRWRTLDGRKIFKHHIEDVLKHLVERDLVRDILHAHKRFAEEQDLPMYLFLCKTCHRGQGDRSYDHLDRSEIQSTRKTKKYQVLSDEEHAKRRMAFLKDCMQVVNRRQVHNTVS